MCPHWLYADWYLVPQSRNKSKRASVYAQDGGPTQPDSRLTSPLPRAQAEVIVQSHNTMNQIRRINTSVSEAA